MTPVLISPEIDYRTELAQLCNRRGLVRYAVEVGTDTGTFAANFLRVWRGQVLWCIDPYITARPDSDYDDLMQWERDSDYQIALQVLGRYGGRVRLLKHPFEEAAAWIRFPVDFAYIDGNHAYEHVRRSIDLIWPLMRDGAIVAGHDFSQEHKPGVVRAVTEFSEEADVQIYITDPEQPNGQYNAWPSWYCYKSRPGSLMYSDRYLHRLATGVDAAARGDTIEEEQREKLLPEHQALLWRGGGE